MRRRGEEGGEKERGKRGKEGHTWYFVLPLHHPLVGQHDDLHRPDTFTRVLEEEEETKGDKGEDSGEEGVNASLCTLESVYHLLSLLQVEVRLVGLLNNKD